jgi:flagellar motor switch protein FliN/FliY
MSDASAQPPIPNAFQKSPSSPPPKGGSPAVPFPQSTQHGAHDSLNFVMDVPVELTIELGRKTARIGEILRLGPGSILELSKVNGEPLDVYVNNRLIARGEAVVIGERYGIRLTEVVVTEDSRQRGGSKE